jgi:hypothetical protein
MAEINGEEKRIGVSGEQIEEVVGKVPTIEADVKANKQSISALQTASSKHTEDIEKNTADIEKKANADDVYSREETDSAITAKVAEIVAGAPKEFDTLKEMSDWLTEHSDSAATMNTAIQANAKAIEENTADIEQNKSDILKAENDIAVNRTTLGTQCKNILKNTTTTVEYKGITYTINADGSVTANGATGSETSYCSFKEYFEISKPAKYTLSGCPSGGSQSTWELQLYKQKQGSNDVLTLDDYGAGVDKFNTKELDAGMYRGYIAIRPNQTIDNLTFYPMLRYADITDSTYEPYVPSLQEQINALVAEIAELKTQITTE